MNNPKLYWLRWIAIIPAAIAGYFITYWIMMLFSIVQTYLFSQDWLDIAIKSVLAVGIGGFSFIVWGSFIAPMHKIHVSLGLLLLLILLSGGALVLLMLNSGTHWESWLQLVAQIIGGIIGYFEVQKDAAQK